LPQGVVKPLNLATTGFKGRRVIERTKRLEGGGIPHEGGLEYHNNLLAARRGDLKSCKLTSPWRKGVRMAVMHGPVAE
jgi:hypothetical protein